MTDRRKKVTPWAQEARAAFLISGLSAQEVRERQWYRYLKSDQALQDALRYGTHHACAMELARILGCNPLLFLKPIREVKPKQKARPSSRPRAGQTSEMQNDR